MKGKSFKEMNIETKMIDFFNYWYLLPTGLVIATLYNSTGISGANFWTPVYILILGLDPLIGFWLSLVSMLFGSMGGLVAHTRHKTIRYFLVKRYIKMSIPFAIIGALSIQYVDLNLLILAFGVFAISYGFIIFYKSSMNKVTLENEVKNNPSRMYPLGAVGGLLTGLISVGLGPLILPEILKHKKISHHSEAIGTTVVIVFITSIFAVFFRLNTKFIESLDDHLNVLISILIYVIPGVLIGSQIGPIVAKRLNLKSMKAYVSLLLIVIGILMLIRFRIL